MKCNKWINDRVQWIVGRGMFCSIAARRRNIVQSLLNYTRPVSCHPTRNQLQTTFHRTRIMFFMFKLYDSYCRSYSIVQCGCVLIKQTVNDGVCSFQESKKVRVSRDLWPWSWPWAHPGCRLTRRPSCVSLVAIRPFVCEKKRFAQKFTDGQTDDGRRPIALAHSWNELINTV